MRKISRKRFFKIVLNLTLLIFVFALAKLSRLYEKFTQTKIYTVDITTLNEGFNFFEQFIVVKRKGQINVFLSKCTHLGCRINKQDSGELVCPCHGSRYNEQGHPVKGPAPGSLEIPDYEIDAGKITIRVTV